MLFRSPTLRLVLATLSGSAGAFAQTAPESPLALDPISVTAQHRGQVATEVPISLTAYSGAFLETQGVTRYEDLAPLVPGFFASVQSPNSPGLNLRGISTDTLDPRAAMRISLFQDGVSISRAPGSITELFDLERVEVLRGPQGTLFGRSAETGAISIITRKPESGVSGRVTVGLGDLGQHSVSGFLNAPLGGDALLGRVAFSSARRDGAVANRADGSTLNGRATVAVRPSLRWLAPGGDTTVDFVFNFQRDTPPGTAFKSGLIPPVGGDPSPYTPAHLNRGAILGTDRTVWGASLHLTHRLAPAWTLHALTGWRAFDAHEEFDGDGSFLALLDSTDESTARTWSQEIRLNYDDGGRFAGFGGLTWARERAAERVSVIIDERQIWPFFSATFRDGLIANGVPAALAHFAVPAMSPLLPQASLPAGFAALAAVPPLSGLAALAGAPLQAEHRDAYTQDARFDAVEAFVDGTWRATDRLELTAGLRLSLEDQRTGYDVRPAAVPSTLGFIFNAAPNFAAAPTAGRLTDEDREAGWSGRLVARYTLSPDLNAYASLARGRRPQALMISSTDRYRIGEESVVNAEVGLKGRALGRRLLWSAALFEYRYRHFHTFIQDPANAARFLAIDAGRATGRGGELALQGHLATGVQVFATYGYTDARFDATGDNGQPQRYAGSSPRLTARHAVALGATFTREDRRYGRFELSPIWQYRSAHFFDDDNTRLGGTLRQPGFARTNLRLTWFSPSRRWEAGAWADNLLDEKFLIDAGNIGADFGLPTYVRGEPCLTGLELTRRW